jgi:hypothetical protein
VHIDPQGQCLRPARAAYRVFTKKWNYTKFRVTEQGDAAKPKGLLARMPDTLEQVTASLSPNSF